MATRENWYQLLSRYRCSETSNHTATPATHSPTNITSKFTRNTVTFKQE